MNPEAMTKGTIFLININLTSKRKRAGELSTDAGLNDSDGNPHALVTQRFRKSADNITAWRGNGCLVALFLVSEPGAIATGSQRRVECMIRSLSLPVLTPGK